MRKSLERAREANRRRQRLINNVRAVCRLGDRAVFELLDEIARETRRRPVIERIARETASISPDDLRITGGDRFPAPPLHLVGSRS